jgi:hypothetical protein
MPVRLIHKFTGSADRVFAGSLLGAWDSCGRLDEAVNHGVQRRVRTAAAAALGVSAAGAGHPWPASSRWRTVSDVPLFRPRCPVPPREQAWIEKMLLWCVDRLGHLPLHRPVVEPTNAFFPGAYLGTEQDVLRTVDQVRAHLAISADRFTVEVAVDEDMPGELGAMPLFPVRRAVVAGHYQQREGRGYVRIDPSQAGDRMRLVAIAAHELCHELLLGRGGVPGADGDDHEPLTDLLTVYTGFGVFTANAAFDFEAYNAGGWRIRSLGYLSEAMFGYALACYAWMRGEAAPEPAWARYLDTNPRGYMKQGAKFLKSALGSTPLAGFEPLAIG